MKIRLIVVGKNKQKQIQDLIEQYTKQMNNFSIIEINDGKNKEDMKQEGKQILEKISADEYVIALAIKGIEFDSEEFANNLEKIANYESSKITFIIGGSYGLSEEVYQRANQKISFSKMTFPHLLIRLFLVEQIYRAIMILKKHPYHK